MGFASGFRTGLEAGGAGRSNMPIIQGLSSMISQYAERAKRPSVRYSFGKGESSYDKYVARKQAEEAAAEEKRRYEEGVRIQREQMATSQQAAEVEQARAQETHESQMASQAQQREQAAEMFTRSKKKEDRIEAYRGMLQGIAAGNKALVEQAWAALSPDMAEEDAKAWEPYKKEMIPDPDDPTGKKMIPKYTVGRDPKTGAPSERALPAPSIDFNEDGTITAQFPGQKEPIQYASVDEFVNKSPVKYMNPEFESKESLEAQKKQRKEGQEQQKFNWAKLENERKKLKDLDERISKARESGSLGQDELAKLEKKSKAMHDRYDKMEKELGEGPEEEGGETKVAKVMVDTPDGPQEAYSGEEKPTPDNLPEGVEVVRDEKGAWHWVDPKTKEKNYFRPPK